MSPLLIVFLIVVSIQILYFCLFILTLRKRRPAPSGEIIQPVSVIVCAHNEVENLRELIPLLLNQDHPQFEVIIVNDRSSDGTYDYLLQASAGNDRLKVITVDHLPDRMHGKKYGITLGIKKAQHEIVLLTDADCRPATRQWIRTMSQQVRPETDFVLGYSPYEKRSGLLNLFIRFETLLTGIQYISFALLGLPYMGVGRNLAYRKSLFLKVKGYTDTMSITGGDDDLFVNKHALGKNTVVCVNPDALVYSIPKSTLREYYGQKVRHLSAGKYYKTRHKVLLGLFSFSYLVTWICALTLVVIKIDLEWVLSLMVIRISLFCLTIQVAANRFGHKFEVWFVPVLEFVFMIYYLSTGWVALVTKKVQWKI
ncbi:MAG: glycosyltransferase [Cyclobacteriaceae bacterium]|nr:glycosyltransferase [Cyclobacteriaceae bacterium]